MTQILADIVDAVFQVSCTYSALNLNYDFEISSSKVTVTCEGKNNLQSGELPVPQFAENKEADRILAKHLKKVKK